MAKNCQIHLYVINLGDVLTTYQLFFYIIKHFVLHLIRDIQTMRLKNNLWIFSINYRYLKKSTWYLLLAQSVLFFIYRWLIRFSFIAGKFVYWETRRKRAVKRIHRPVLESVMFQEDAAESHGAVGLITCSNWGSLC